MRGAESVGGALRATCALVSVLAGGLGGVAVGIGVAALPRPWTSGYVSEAGVTGAGHASFYRLGVALLAVCLALLGAALVDHGATPTDAIAGSTAWRSVNRVAFVRFGSSALLVAAGVLCAVSSRVSCTAGCPLPPYARTTPADLVHAGASIAAVGLATLAMSAIALRDLAPRRATPAGLTPAGLTPAGLTPAGIVATSITPAGVLPTSIDYRLRRIARVSFAVSAPPLAALTICLLAIGRSTATAVLERFSLLAVLGWAMVTGITIVRGTGRR